MRPLAICVACLALVACGSSHAPTPPPAPQPGPQSGGSNLLSWTADAANGYIARFDQAPAGLIASQLAQMYANGQRRLRLVVEFHEGGGDGVGLDSAAGSLNAKESANLAGLLSLIRSTDFQALEVFIGEQWKNNPAQWVNPGAWDSPAYGKCVSAIVGSGSVWIAGGLT